MCVRPRGAHASKIARGNEKTPSREPSAELVNLGFNFLVTARVSKHESDLRMLGTRERRGRDLPQKTDNRSTRLFTSPRAAYPLPRPSRFLTAGARMAAAADAASAVDALDRLVRVVRADADGRHQLAVRAAFVGALARSHPEVVREPGVKRSWTPAALAALAAATTSLLQSKHELHCVVGVDDFAVNVSYKKKSLVYLRADIKPALRVLTYASLPAAASGEANRGAHVREDDDTTTTTTTPDVTNTRSGASVFPASLLTSASSAAYVAARAALDDAAAGVNDATVSESPASSAGNKKKEEKERRAVALSHALRLSLQASFPDAHWHVAHDWRLNPLGVAPATSTTRALEIAKDDFVYVAWRHASRPPGFFNLFKLVAADRGTLTLARRSFLVVVLAYAMWFNSMCDPDGSAKMSEKEKQQSRSFGDAPLRSAEDPLTATLCAAAPRAAPFALVALTLMGGNYAMGLARRVAAHAAGRNARKSKKA